MSVSQLARAGRIDSAANSAAQKASNLNSQLNAMTDEVLAFAAFMHTDPRTEVERYLLKLAFKPMLWVMVLVFAQHLPLRLMV